MAEKEHRRITVTKRMLKDAFIELLKEKSIYNISIRELCETACVNRTTFYKHYGSQFDLLTDMENDMLTLVNRAIAKNSENGFMIVSAACRYLEENIELSRLLLNNNVDPQFPQKLFSLTLIKQIIAKSAKGSYSNAEAEYMYHFMTYGVYQIYRVWINKENRESPEQIAGLIMKLTAKQY